jgi:hypothetical protein
VNKNFIKQDVSPSLAFSIVLILSFLLAWYTVNTAEKVVENAKGSTTFDTSKRMEKLK